VPSLEKVLFRFRALWEESFEPDQVRIVREGHSVEHYLEIGERCLRQFYRLHYPFDADETLGLEERVQYRDPEHGYRVQGFVDRVVRARDGAIEIHDYKTSRRIPSQKRLDADRQLALYQIALRERHPETPMRLVWHYLTFGATRVSTRTAEQLDALRAEIGELVRRIEAAEQFEARPSALCDWCEYRDACPAARGKGERAAQPAAAAPAEGAMAHAASRSAAPEPPASAPSAPSQMDLL
jgi:putative RecB family exonuclease